MAGKTIGEQSDDHVSCLDYRLESPKVKWLGKPSENSQYLQLKLSRKNALQNGRVRENLQLQLCRKTRDLVIFGPETASPLLLLWFIATTLNVQ